MTSRAYIAYAPDVRTRPAYAWIARGGIPSTPSPAFAATLPVELLPPVSTPAPTPQRRCPHPRTSGSRAHRRSAAGRGAGACEQTPELTPAAAPGRAGDDEA